MGYGSEAASSVGGAASNAGNLSLMSDVGSSAGSAANGLSLMDGASLSTGDAIANASGGSSATSSVGGSVNSLPGGSNMSLMNGGSLADGTLNTNGASNFGDTIKGWFKDYAAGGEQDFGQALDNAGFNMKTAGYIGKKIPTGGAPAMPQMNIPQGQTAGTTTDPMEHFRKRRMQYGGY